MSNQLSNAQIIGIAEQVAKGTANTTPDWYLKYLEGDMPTEMDKSFRDFVIQYEGAAADLPRSIQILRGLIRPVMTILINGFLFYIIWHWFTGVNLPDGSELALKIMFALALLVNAFWFGEKMVIRSGLADMLKNWNNGK